MPHTAANILEHQPAWAVCDCSPEFPAGPSNHHSTADRAKNPRNPHVRISQPSRTGSQVKDAYTSPLIIVAEFANEVRVPCERWYISRCRPQKQTSEPASRSRFFNKWGAAPNAHTPATPPVRTDTVIIRPLQGPPTMQRAKQHETRFSRVSRTKARVVFFCRHPRAQLRHGARSVQRIGKGCGNGLFREAQRAGGRRCIDGSASVSWRGKAFVFLASPRSRVLQFRPDLHAPWTRDDDGG